MTLAECGKRRALMQRDIRMRMAAAGYTQTDLARALGITPQAVWATVNGVKHSLRILDALRELGVPERFLCDPRREYAGKGEAA